MSDVTRNKYQLPIPPDKLINIDTDSSPAHAGKLENAIDFVAPENTIVLAAVREQSHMSKTTPILEVRR